MADDVRGEILAEVTRSGLVESHHSGHLVLLAADGSIQLWRGEPSDANFPALDN